MDDERKGVDVLEVMEEAQVLAEHHSEPDLAVDVSEARAAVAELIEAAAYAVGWIDDRFQGQPRQRIEAALVRCQPAKNPLRYHEDSTG